MRLGGVTRAAEELALAQSTVSGLLRKLSDTVGAPVLHARGGRVELTDTGRAVAQLCEEILESLQRFELARETGLLPYSLDPCESQAHTMAAARAPAN